MSSSQSTIQIEQVIREMDRLISEMIRLRGQVAALNSLPTQPGHSIRETECFGMWADRQDMHGRSSREWLESLRAQQLPATAGGGRNLE